MKLTSIEIHTTNFAEPIVLSFRDPQSKLPFIIQNITGLDPESLSTRVIAMQIGLNPTYRRPSVLRDTVYKTISASRSGLVTLHFKNGATLVATTEGYITKVENDVFSKSQSVTVTLQCDDALIRGVDRIFTDLDEGRINLSNVRVLDSTSSAPHGMVCKFTVKNVIPSVQISSLTDPGWVYNLSPVGGFLVGDVITFSSEVLKYINMIRAGVETQLADAIDGGAVWPVIYPGPNSFEFSNPTKLTLNELSYLPAYWGV